MIALFKYMTQHLGQIADLLMEHIEMTAIAVGFAILIGVPPVSYTHLTLPTILRV